MTMKEKKQNLIHIATRCDATILLTGPTGSGKSLLARKIHDQSARKNKTFVTVNLACLPEGTLESELFGHERGAFTGADQKRIGRLELANGGTVFLDEVGELTPRLQARLLEFLQSKTIVPVGGNREVRLDVRIIAATHRDLARGVEQGEFREDLFHRLRVLSIQLPSLIEQSDEFDTILHRCLEEMCIHYGREVLRISPDAAYRLENYSWPGNFRELRNVLEFAVLASDGPEILASDLPEWFGNLPRSEAPLCVASSLDAKDTKADRVPALGKIEFSLGLDYQLAHDQFEKIYLEKALRRFHGRVNHTARQIGLNKTTFIRRLRVHGLSAKEILNGAPANVG